MKLFYNLFLISIFLIFNQSVHSQIVYSGTKTVNSSQNMTLDIFIDPTADSVEIVFTGPINKWRGIGFGTSSMSGTYAIITDGAGNIVERKLGNHNAGTVLTSSFTSTSHSTAGSIATTTVTRSLSGLTADHYTFTGGIVTIPIIWGYGSGSTFAQHAGRGATTISITQDCSNGNTASTINPVVCDTYTSSNGFSYFFTGTYTEIVSNSIGCDSVITINLTVNSNSSSISQSACSEYTSPSGLVFTTSGTYMDTIQNVAGCDSVITIDLEIQNTSSSINIISCDPSVTSQSGNQSWNASGTYTDTIGNAAGCDSIITVDLQLISPSSSMLTAEACNEYISPSGSIYTTSGTYTDIIPNAAGCDSTITITLNVTELNNTVVVLNSHPNFPNHVGEVLQSGQSGATYKWTDCDNNYSHVTGETNELFAPSTPGTYAVIVENGMCIDTSDCVQVFLLSMPIAKENSLSVYPNPSKSIVYFSFSETSSNAQVRIYDLTGKLVKSVQLLGSETAVKLPESLGVYFAKVEVDGELIKTIKLVKQ